MPEIELKLDVTSEDFETLLASRLLGEPVDSIKRHETYFDTAENSLEKAGFSLRIRRTGTSLVQTIKATGPSAPLFIRPEWEMPVASLEPALDDAAPLASRFGTIVPALCPLFEVDVVRQTWTATENGSHIDVSADRGEVIAGERRLAGCELDLELKDGKPADLFRLARKIGAIIPVAIGVQSKTERGYRLLDAAPVAIKADLIHLETGHTVGHAFRVIAGSCFRQFRLNETILRRRHSAQEALHQARVALRRLRTAFSVFRPHLGGEAERLSDAFRWLAHLLGDARDLDVLMAKTTSPASDAKLRQAQNTAQEAALAALSSPQARVLMIDFNEWLQSGDYLQASALDEPVVDFAARALDKLRRKLKKNGRDLAGLTDDERHQIRKDAKRLRYAAEFFGCLFDDKRGQRRLAHFSDAMERLQDQLGALNDLVTGPQIAARYGLAALEEGEQAYRPRDKAKLIGRSQAALDDLLDAKKFWR